LYVVTEENIRVYDVRDLNNISLKGESTGHTGLHGSKLQGRRPTMQSIKYLGGHLIMATSDGNYLQHKVITIR